jgi:plasmid stabilization system protein ParE
VSDFSVFLSPDAERDIAGALTWYRERSMIAADAFRAEIFDAIDSSRALDSPG